jgi:Zn-dependent M28 family amino/carboxypeptidase
VERYTPEYGRNVVGIVRGSDPTLRNEYVVIGAHNDHTGFTVGNAVDHDSLKAYRDALTKLQIRGTDSLVPATPELTSQIRVNVDSLRRIRPARRDSIRNGADDDGSGSMAVLEIAEAVALAPVKPKRSIVFIWHTGEESGLLGSAFYSANPTVPREAIVANINMDMVGRGRAEDLPGGGPDYLAVVGADRLSTELGKVVQDVNRAQRRPLKLDAKFDLPTTWAGYNNIYGRSDHANYARYGIPIAFFFTGLHGDYHQLTDEPAYIDYPHYNRIANYVRDLLVAVGNLPTRPKVDRPGQ